MTMILKNRSKPGLAPKAAPYEVRLKSGKIVLFTSITEISTSVELSTIESVLNRLKHKPVNLAILVKRHKNKTKP